MATSESFYATGRRKHASARVYLKPGSGRILVNKREADEYFRRESLRRLVMQPFEAVEMPDRFDVFATVLGGGTAGQAGAVRHGISRALTLVSGDLRTVLKRGGFLTRDSRVKERKKYGRPGARKRFQFSKR